MDIARALKVIAIVLTVWTGAITASGQGYVNTPVSISKEKVRINGQVCYSHVVLERQTLFSISKAYNVSVEDIYKFNPAVKEHGLVKNSIIIIPVIEDEAKQPEQQDEAARETTVLSQDAGTPEIKEQKAEEGKKRKKKTHTVKWYENIDDIAEKYGVSAEEIMAANNLQGRKLKSRMKLTIPEPGETVLIPEQIAENTAQQTDTTATTQAAEAQEETVINQEKDSWWPFRRNEKVTASLLLPFKATGTSGSKSNMDFYSGVLLAVNDLAATGISTDLNVFDIADGNYDTAGNTVSESDIIIGPVSVRDLSIAVSAAGQTPMLISPLDPKAEALVSSHPNMIQAPTPHKLQYDDLAAWMKEDCRNDDHVILISEKGARLTEAAMEMKHSVDSAGLNYRSFSYSILEGRDVEKPLKELMTQSAANRVLIISESEAFVNDVVRNLNMMIHQKYDIVLYGASKIRSFETIEVENFHKTNLHVSLTYYIDYDDQRVKNFLLKYRALFNAEPTQFAFQGYDIASYFIEMCSRYGKNWPYRMSEEEKSMLQSTFRCLKDGEGGYINHGVRRIIYEKDWTIDKVR